jgi:pimeloyl-ACP methyl ester carboxylesterase
VAYDARAHGRSQGGGPYTYERLASDLEQVLDDRGIDKAVLAGASMGAHTLIHFALTRPERVKGLVVMTPAYDPDDDRTDRFAHWDRLANGLRTGGVEGFITAYGEPDVPEKWRETIDRVLHQRLAAHAHPDALADAIEQVPRSRPFEHWDDLEAIQAPTVTVVSRDEVDPEHPYAIGERYTRAIPGARMVSEDEGASPLAWQGAQVSKVISSVAERPASAP